MGMGWPSIFFATTLGKEKKKNQNKGEKSSLRSGLFNGRSNSPCTPRLWSTEAGANDFLRNSCRTQRDKKTERWPEGTPAKNVESRLFPKKSYDDDESLLSHATGRSPVRVREREADVSDEEEGEFRGFFISPESTRSDVFRDSGNVAIMVSSETALVSARRSHETYALVLRVKAPALPRHSDGTAAVPASSHRAPVDVVAVLDVGRSMAGRKIEMLRRTMCLLISSLGPADRLSIIVFSVTVKRLLPLRRMTVHGQRSARHIVERLGCGHREGTTSPYSDALREATKILDDRRERNHVASVILLSDSVGTGGRDDCRRSPAAEPSTRFSHLEIAGNEFAECVSGFLSVVVQELRLYLDFTTGSDPAEITAVYSINGRSAAVGSASDCIWIGDLYAEEERELLLEIRVPTTSRRLHHAILVRSSAINPSMQEIVSGAEQVLAVPPLPSVSQTPDVERLRSAFIATRALAECRILREQNDMSAAFHQLVSARDLLMQSGSKSAVNSTQGLEAEIAALRRTIGKVEMEEEVSKLEGRVSTPTSPWRAAKRLARTKKTANRVSDLHGLENARF